MRKSDARRIVEIADLVEFAERTQEQMGLCKASPVILSLMEELRVMVRDLLEQEEDS